MVNTYSILRYLMLSQDTVITFCLNYTATGFITDIYLMTHLPKDRNIRFSSDCPNKYLIIREVCVIIFLKVSF